LQQVKPEAVITD